MNDMNETTQWIYSTNVSVFKNKLYHPFLSTTDLSTVHCKYCKYKSQSSSRERWKDALFEVWPADPDRMVLCGQKVGIDQAPERQSQSYATWMTAALPLEGMVMDETICMCIVIMNRLNRFYCFFYSPRILVRFFSYEDGFFHHR